MTHRNMLASVLIIVGLWSPTLAQDNTIGQESFQAHCAVCHGATGTGDGEFADVLTVKPANLTLLSSKNGGVFPYLNVLRVIDGRTTLRAHGSSTMPIWGDVFKEEIGESSGPYGAELLIRARVIALVDYLETLQK